MGKTYWLVTTEDDKTKSSGYFIVDGPIFRVSDIKKQYGEKAVILFCMQLTKEQYEYFKG